MEKYLNAPIKEIIEKFPEVGEILDEYKIGCVPCNVGSCLLKDIVEIHNLSGSDEEELLKRIAGAIYPGQEVEIPKIERKHAASDGELNYSPPLKKLVDEHVLIKKLVSAIPEVIKILDVESEEGRRLVLDCVYFIRTYADKYHHAKEEDILFKFFDDDLDILKVMHEDHETARACVRAIVDALERKDKETIVKNLTVYFELLTEHIKKEDEILYPWMDRNLSTAQIGELFARFNEVDEKVDKEAIDKCTEFVEKLSIEIMDEKKKEEVK